MTPQEDKRPEKVRELIREAKREFRLVDFKGLETSMCRCVQASEHHMGVPANINAAHIHWTVQWRQEQQRLLRQAQATFVDVLSDFASAREVDQGLHFDESFVIYVKGPMKQHFKMIETVMCLALGYGWTMDRDPPRCYLEEWHGFSNPFHVEPGWTPRQLQVAMIEEWDVIERELLNRRSRQMEW